MAKDRYAWLFNGERFEDVRILDAATGAGGMTQKLARRAGGSTRIVSVDIDQDTRVLDSLQSSLQTPLTFIEDDLHQLQSVPDAAFDVVVCDDTLAFLSMPPLRTLSAIDTFHRVLKDGGRLLISAESPDESRHPTGEWRRWQLAKAVFALKGEAFYEPIHRNDLTRALARSGFHVEASQSFPGGMMKDFEPLIEEWEAILLHEIVHLPWGEGLKKTLHNTVVALSRSIRADGYLDTPDTFAVKAVKRGGRNV